MNALIQWQHQLAQSVQTDPVLRLIHWQCWLNPLWPLDALLEEESEPGLLSALAVLRQPFPDIYLDALLNYQQGASYADLNHQICEQLQGHGLPVYDIEWLAWGIPLPAYGVDSTDPDTFDHIPAWPRLLACFDLEPDPDDGTVSMPKGLFAIADTLITSLQNQPDTTWQAIGHALAWSVNATGNTLADCTAENLHDFTPLGWNPDDIAFARELIDEAEQLMAHVHDGLQCLTQDHYYDTLHHHIQELQRWPPRLMLTLCCDWHTPPHGSTRCGGFSTMTTSKPLPTVKILTRRSQWRCTSLAAITPL